MPLAMLNAIPALLFLVDRDRRFLWANTHAHERLGVMQNYTHRKRGGEVLRCLQAVQHPDGCGRAPACERCVVRRSVEQAFAGRHVGQEKTTMRLQTETSVRDVHLLVTAAPVPHSDRDLAMLIIQDISELIKLRSLIPICASCKKIRNDDRYWQSVEEHFRDRLDVDFSHSICPGCRSKLYPKDES